MPASARGRSSLAVAVLAILASPAVAQVSPADYERASGLREKYQAAAVNVAEPATWIKDAARFWYRKSVKDGHEFVMVDAATSQKRPAFDHEKLAAALSKATGGDYKPRRLPFNSVEFQKDDVIEVRAEGSAWRCTLTEYSCSAAPRTGLFERQQPPPSCTPPGPGATPVKSPDGKWEAVVSNFNVAVRPAGSRTLTLLSLDGSESTCYELRTVTWAPDSTRLAAYRVRPGFRRMVHYVESSPEDQLQPKHSTRFYAKPGDVLDHEQPVIFQLEPRRQVEVDPALFPNPYDMSALEWRKDGRAVTFEYNQRGHQVYRVIEVDAATGAARAVISEEPETFFTYSSKKFRRDLDDGREVVWMSERDGWNHLYLYDGVTGQVKQQITSGPWVVRGVSEVDEKKRVIYFSASGMTAGRDPYLVDYFRIGLDGTGLTKLTPADANHSVAFSSDLEYFVDTYSRVDMAPVMELRRTADTSLVAEIERADLAGLTRAGWRQPEPFVAKGRDGVTDIWGVIYRPTSFDPAKKYPVIENIYAGPHSSFVPKSFAAYHQMQAQAELGFIVVQIDGMGTSNRSKAFHDVAWRNLKDAGFPDRILWHRAVAARYPWYDVSRVGIYGTSAGGQSALGALLFHPDFYDVAVSAVGCHDNRMDKIWWNEQWMGWPIGSHYADSSNVVNAHALRGKVLLVVGELDTNVDPASTYQVVNALIKAKKDFELLVVPGAGHGPGGEYGERRRFDFFVEHLLGAKPPDWNALAGDAKASQPAARP